MSDNDIIIASFILFNTKGLAAQARKRCHMSRLTQKACKEITERSLLKLIQLITKTNDLICPSGAFLIPRPV